MNELMRRLRPLFAAALHSSEVHLVECGFLTAEPGALAQAFSPASPPKTRKPASFRSPGAALGGAAKRAASPGLPVSAAPAKAARVAVVDKVSSVFSVKR